MRVGTWGTVDQEAGQADLAGEGVGNGARLLLRASEVPGSPRARGALPRRVPELDHDRAPVVRIGGEALGAARVGPLHHAGADREAARRFGEHGHRKRPGGQRAHGDQADAGHGRRQSRPPPGPPRRSAGTPDRTRHGEQRREGGAREHRQHLPAEPHRTQHDRGQEDDRPRRRRDACADGGRKPARHHQRDGTQQDKAFQRGQVQPRDGLGHPAILGAGCLRPHRTQVALACDLSRSPGTSLCDRGRTGGTPRTSADAGGGGESPGRGGRGSGPLPPSACSPASAAGSPGVPLDRPPDSSPSGVRSRPSHSVMPAPESTTTARSPAGLKTVRHAQFSSAVRSCPPPWYGRGRPRPSGPCPRRGRRPSELRRPRASRRPSPGPAPAASCRRRRPGPYRARLSTTRFH